METFMTGEMIDLDAERRKRWHAKIHRMRELGETAIFGHISEQNATILQFPEIIKTETPDTAS